MCFAVLWALRIYGMKMWPSVVMLCSLWLQHSYFLGATSTISFFKEHIVQRNHEVLLESQQRQQQLQQLQIEATVPINTTASAPIPDVFVKDEKVDQEEEEKNEVVSSLQITSENEGSAPPFESPKNEASGKGSLRNRKHKISKDTNTKVTLDEVNSPGYNTRSRSAQKEKSIISETKENEEVERQSRKISVDSEQVGPFTS